MGHVRNYVINDILAREMRMKGYNVLMPMGWDAFGLPAENAAMASGVPPSEWTQKNIDDMKQQMEPLSLAIDWSRELATCDPDYYRWNQWFFLRLLEKGLAYKETQTVNWDPVDQTVLANEQVIDGRGWRSGALVEKKEIPGYYLKITKYAESLNEGIEDLVGWPEQVRTMQRNWIGKREGVRFAFTHSISDANGKRIDDGLLWVFTTRADTIMGVTFCAVAPEHPIAIRASEIDPAVASFVEECTRTGTSEVELMPQEKAGVQTGLHAIHPISGERVDIWVGNYVLSDYEGGAVMGVPAHDKRDFMFAKKYGLDIKQVVSVVGEMFSDSEWQEWYEDSYNGIVVNSGKYDGLNQEDATHAVAADLTKSGLGEKRTSWRLRDWGISRQRYWGTPIPIIHCEECGDVPVPDSDLPVLLPLDCVPDGTGNPLVKLDSFYKVDCPKCGGDARRETDTMDTFVDSAWYFMRYACPGAESMVDERTEYWMPMDRYIGGVEHAVLHLLYARFWTRVMRDMGLVSMNEPFKNLFTQGMLLNESFFREDSDGRKTWFYPSEVEVTRGEKGQVIAATLRKDGMPVELGGMEKMSKSKNNVIEPREIIDRYGADTARFFTIFVGPPTQSAVWSDSGVEGAYRFLRRLWVFAHSNAKKILSADSMVSKEGVDKDLRREIHETVDQIVTDYERLHYNTVASGVMKILNSLEKHSSCSKQAVREGMNLLLRSLYPISPHIAHILWKELGFEGSIVDAPWPRPSADALEKDAVSIGVQINGKLRGQVSVPASANEKEVELIALEDERIGSLIDEGVVRRVIVVPGRLINFVLS
jgi:leucyl-tRNA synthetase